MKHLQALGKGGEGSNSQFETKSRVENADCSKVPTFEYNVSEKVYMDESAQAITGILWFFISI